MLFRQLFVWLGEKMDVIGKILGKRKDVWSKNDIIAYHGSPYAESIRREGFGTPRSTMGYHFAVNKEMSKSYGELVKAKIKNKKFASSKVYDEEYKQLEKEGYRKGSDKLVTELRRRLESKGYRGINAGYAVIEGKKVYSPEVVVFHKKDIKVL